MFKPSHNFCQPCIALIQRPKSSEALLLLIEIWRSEFNLPAGSWLATLIIEVSYRFVGGPDELRAARDFSLARECLTHDLISKSCQCVACNVALRECLPAEIAPLVAAALSQRWNPWIFSHISLSYFHSVF